MNPFKYVQTAMISIVALLLFVGCASTPLKKEVKGYKDSLDSYDKTIMLASTEDVLQNRLLTDVYGNRHARAATNVVRVQE